MRIGINALYLLPGRVGGSEVYIRSLVKFITRAGSTHEFFIFINRETKGVFDALAPPLNVIECNVRACSRVKRILYEQVVLPVKVRDLKIDALFSAGMTAPFFCPVKSVLAIYDLQHINQPENFPRMQLPFLRGITRLSAKGADRIVTISHAVKRDIVTHYKIPGHKVFVAHLAADRKVFFPRDEKEVADARRRLKLPDRYILYLASSLPHKNYERLLNAFLEVRASEPGVKLLLAGAREHGAGEIKEKIESLGLGNDVVLLGWLPFEDIPLLYSAASLLAFPSLHEGFGIPVVEAMASGVPVVCSSIEVLKEVAADAALFVDPLLPQDIARGMLRVLRDKALREDIIKKGINRAAQFSWENTAGITLKAIEGLMEKA